MFYKASAFNHDISSWTGYAATTAQTEMFLDATAFQAKFTCTNAVTGPPNSCACTKCIPDASWHVFVSECLAEAPVTGECTEWASGKPYGTMPNWDTSLVTDMSGDWKAHGFGGKRHVNAIFRSGIREVRRCFNVLSSFCVQPRHWELEHGASD